MSGILGLINRSATDDTYVNTVGQDLVFEATQTYLDRINTDIQSALSVFVEETTTGYKERYKLPGGGRMQKRAPHSSGGAVRAYGEWDVAFPLEGFDEQVAGDEVDVAYMTMAEYQRHVDTIQIRYINALRYEMLLKVFKNTNTTFSDRLKGSLTIVPLANGDTVTYPPVLGSESEATEDHYLESGYAATAINDDNNPLITIKNDLYHHFGQMTGGYDIVVFINNDERNEIEDLTDFTPVEDRYIRSGDNVDIPFQLPSVPGEVIGRSNGVWVVDWAWMPDNYMFGVHLGTPAPLKMRVDEAGTGLPQGLALVSNDTRYPFQAAHWRARFGFGVGNRLNGVVMELGTGGTYTIPTAYQ